MNTCKSWMLLFLEDGGIYIEFVWIIPCPAQSWFDIHYNNLTHRLTTALHSSCGHLLYCVFCFSAQLSIIFFSPTFSWPRVGQAIAVANHTCWTIGSIKQNSPGSCLIGSASVGWKWGKFCIGNDPGAW